MALQIPPGYGEGPNLAGSFALGVGLRQRDQYNRLLMAQEDRQQEEHEQARFTTALETAVRYGKDSKTMWSLFKQSYGPAAPIVNFDHVPGRTVIYHRYYFHDRLTAAVKLYLRSPAWSTYSTIQLREADKGPWRVDITDENGNVFRTLRFSISE